MKEVNIAETVDKVLNDMKQHEHHRYESWQNCFAAFASPDLDTDTLALHLGFYLASWGMYRGSGGLLQKSHTVHKGAVEILRSTESNEIRCSNSNEVTKEQADIIIELKKRLAVYYVGIPFSKNEEENNIKDTATLISKITLGTLGCTPAFDRYFAIGWNDSKEKFTKNPTKQTIPTTLTFNKKLLEQVFGFINEYEQELLDEQAKIGRKYNFHYPLMRIVDMYFWQKGFDIEMKEKIEAKKNVIGV